MFGTTHSFIIAIENGDLSTAIMLKPQINTGTFLYGFGRAIIKGHMEMVRHFEPEARLVARPDLFDMISLRKAIEGNQLEMVKYFVDKIKDKSDFTQEIQTVFLEAMFQPHIMEYLYSLNVVDRYTIQYVESLLNMVNEDISGSSLVVLKKMVV